MPTEETNTNVVIEEETKEEVKKIRKPREKARPVEELLKLPAKKLTDKEKDALIEHYREELKAAENREANLRDVVNSTFKQNRDIEDRYENMEKFYNRTIRYIDKQLEAFHAAVTQATRGGAQ